MFNTAIPRHNKSIIWLGIETFYRSRRSWHEKRLKGTFFVYRYTEAKQAYQN